MTRCKECGIEFEKKHGRQVYCTQHAPKKTKLKTENIPRIVRVNGWMQRIRDNAYD